MKKAIILTLALWTGLSNFAYAQSRIECADRMQKGVTQSCMAEKKAASASCHHTTPCKCATEIRQEEQSSPVSYSDSLRMDTSSPVIITISDLSKEPAGRRSQAPFYLTEKPPLYTLFSVYRI